MGEPLRYVHGYGMLVPGLEKGLSGLGPGDAAEIVVPPEEAYGLHDEELVFAIDRSDAPNAGEGDEVVLEDEDGDEAVARVVEVGDEELVVDGNHPLAGMTLRYRVHVREVREATPTRSRARRLLRRAARRKRPASRRSRLAAARSRFSRSTARAKPARRPELLPPDFPAPPACATSTAATMSNKKTPGISTSASASATSRTAAFRTRTSRNFSSSLPDLGDDTTSFATPQPAIEGHDLLGYDP